MAKKNVEVFHCFGFRGRIFFLVVTKNVPGTFFLVAKNTRCNKYMWCLFFLLIVSRCNTNTARQQEDNSQAGTVTNTATRQEEGIGQYLDRSQQPAS